MLLLAIALAAAPAVPPPPARALDVDLDVDLDVALVLTWSDAPAAAPLDAEALSRDLRSLGLDRIEVIATPEGALAASLDADVTAALAESARLLAGDGVSVTLRVARPPGVPAPPGAELRPPIAPIARALLADALDGSGVRILGEGEGRRARDIFRVDAPGVDAPALFALWREHVERGEVLALEATLDPETRRLADASRGALRGLLRRIDATYGLDVLRAAAAAPGCEVAVSAGPVEEARGAFDADGGGPWTVPLAPDGAPRGWVEVRPAGRIGFDRVWLEVPADGARVGFRLLARRSGGDWCEVARGAGLSGRRIVDVAWCEADALRLALEGEGAAPALSRIGLFATPPTVTIEPAGEIALSPVAVSLSTRAGAEVRYTLDGSAPGADSPRYEGPVRIESSATLRARAFGRRGPGVDVASASFTIVTEGDWLEAVTFVRAPDPGLRVEVFEVSLDSLVDLDDASPIARREVEGVDAAAHATRRTRVALRYTGFVVVPEDCLYTFASVSDDGSRIWLHDRLVVDNDGHHGERRQQGKVPLRAGVHPIRIEWFNGVGPGRLEVRWSGLGVGRDVEVPASAYRR